MNIKIQIEKDGKIYEKQLTTMMFHNIYDFMYIIDDRIWDDVEANYMQKDINKLFRLSAEIVDIHNEGRTYNYKKGKMHLSKHKFFHSGRKPRWNVKKQTALGQQ